MLVSTSASDRAWRGVPIDVLGDKWTEYANILQRSDGKMGSVRQGHDATDG